MINLKTINALSIGIVFILSIPVYAKDAKHTSVTVDNDTTNPVPVLIENDSTNPASVTIENTSPIEVVINETKTEKRPHFVAAFCFDDTDTFKSCYTDVLLGTYFEVLNISGGSQNAEIISMAIAQGNNVSKSRWYAPSITLGGAGNARNAFVADGFYIIEPSSGKYTAPDGRNYGTRILLTSDMPFNVSSIHLVGWLHTK